MAVAATPREAQRFWRDRKRLGAIAARTNAFKLNEDIVLPLGALAEFAEFIDTLNTEEERGNQEETLYQLMTYIESAEPAEDPEWLDAKLPRAREILREALQQVKLAGRARLLAASHIRQVAASMAELLRGYAKVKAEIDRDIADIRNRRIVVATHMHAGDGNVHVNIPVFSNDREMMRRAAEVADLVMEKTVELGGVVSGEHGIGFTKIRHLEPEIMASFQAYLEEADPHNLINPGKLTDRGVADRVFTPSFNLIELEARILRYGRLEKLAEKISKCVRCGRCKTGCCVFYPAANLFYHPRNKNLALSAIIEALLYDAQRSRTVGLRPLHWLKEIADHCTLCHKCQAPCPVNIDTAEVSILEREVLAGRRAKSTALPTRVVLGYLASRSNLINAVVRRMVLQWGGALQRTGSRLLGRFAAGRGTGSPLAPLYAPAPPIVGKPLAAWMPSDDANAALVVTPEGGARSTVVYFPGCGSERLHSDIALAAVFLLMHAGVRVVLPPKYLCCGYPARANAQEDLCTRQELRNTIVLSQIRSMLGHYDFDACIVSCGTCREALVRIGMEAIFDAPLADISKYVVNRGVEVELPGVNRYHEPCHDSLGGEGAALVAALSPAGVVVVPHCCSEAGTLALSRPDIAAAMLERKRAAMPDEDPSAGSIPVITNCPACLGGLGRQGGVRPVHMAVVLAEAVDAGGWRRAAVRRLARGASIRF
jgi:Fe-S oxidoreductase